MVPIDAGKTVRIIIAICTWGCAASASKPALPTNAAPAVTTAAAIADPDQPHRGALCFGGQGPTDIRAFNAVAREIFDRNLDIEEIGTCQITSAPSESGYREILIVAGTTEIAALNGCGGRALAPGVSGPRKIQIGDSTRALAAFSNLECSPEPGGYRCYEATTNDPSERYFISDASALTAAGNNTLHGPAAVALVAGKTIAGASFTTRCD